MKHLRLLLALFTLMIWGASSSAQTDVTATYLTNPGFDGCTAETSDVAAKTIKDYSSSGWTNASTGSFSTIAVTTYGGGVKVGDSNTPSTKKDGTTVSGNTLGIIAGWGDEVKIQSSDITLPAGVYTLTVDHYLTSSTNNYGSNSSRFGFVTSGNSYLVSSTTFSASTWTTETVTFTLTESTTGKIQIGLKGLNKSGSGSPAVFYDDVTLTWTDPNAAANAAKLEAAKYTLNGYIKKATALNVVLSDATLTTAIGTAQGVYDAADNYAEDYDNTVNAATTLNSAISSALNSTTSVALVNGNFDTTPNNILSGEGTVFGGTLSTATSNPDNTKDFSANTGDHAYLYEVSGWTQYSKFNSTASQGTTSEYGTAMPANGWSTNSTTPPAADMFGGSEGAALHLSAGWGDQARYQQTIASLPSGRYVMYYEVINQYNNTGIASNYIGVNGTAGDFYGTSNAFVYSSLNSIEQGLWKAQAFEFDVAKTADINFSVGVTTSTSGSGSGAKLWIDNVLVYRIGDVVVTTADADAILAKVAALDNAVYNATDKSTLATAKNTFEGNKNIDNYNALNAALIAAKASVAVYTTLDAAITKVEGWTATTAVEGIRAKYTNGEYTNETAVDIFVEYQAAEIAALTAISATDFTSVILNHSFETGDMTGWSAESRSDTGVKENSNGTYTINNGVDGSYIFNSWGGTAENNVYQTIKNLPAGTYQLSALLAGFTGEELVLAANDVTNSVTVSGDKTTGNTVNVVFTLTAAADVVIKASNTKVTSADASFIKADNFTLKAFSDPLAALKEQLTTLQAEATTVLANADYANVTGEEKTTLTTLSTLIPTETEEAYNEAISDITDAISTFTGSKAAYDKYAEIKTVAETLNVETGEAPANAAAAAEAVNTLNVAVYQAVTAENMFDVTEDINPSWSNMTTASGQHWSGDNSVAYADNWSGSANTTERSATITLSAGEYVLMSAGRGSTNTVVTMTANETTVTYTSKGDTGYGIDTEGNANFDASGTYANSNNGRGWEWRYIPVTLTEETTVTLKQKLTRLSGNAWGSFADFKIMKKADVADDADYAELAAAIAVAEATTLGFETGEYAPYENVTALEALAVAKTIDQEAVNTKEAVQAATTALTSATWTANTEEVNAVYNGSFDSAIEGDWGLTGWTRTNAWGQQQTGIEGEYATAYYNQPGSLKYGENGVYTMPLKANTSYTLKFAYRSHENGSNNGITVSVLNGEEGISGKTFPGNGSTSEWKIACLAFTTGAAGDYVLTLANSGNTWMTGVEVFKAKPETVTIKSGFKGTTYSSEYPLDFTNSGLTAYIITDVENGKCSATEVTKVPAKTGVYVEGESNSYTVNVVGENVDESNAFDSIDENLLVGTGNQASASLYSDNNTTYYMYGKIELGGKDSFYKVSTDPDYARQASAHKAYLAIPGAQNAKALIIVRHSEDVVSDDGGFADGINNVEQDDNNAKIYNLNGQRVNNAQKGIYIKNGKKVIIK